MRATFALCLLPLLVPAACIGAWQYATSRTHQAYGEPTARVDTRRKVVALTFDDGPSPAAVASIIATLQAHHARATFFVTGRELQRHPAAGAALVAAGNELGNHSYSHPRMLFMDRARIAREIEDTDALIRAAGQAGPIHFRPPYGIKGLALPRYLQASGRRTIMWNVEPDSDRRIAATSEAIVAHVLAEAKPGSIILLHAMYASRRTSLAAVPGIVAGLQARGYDLVTVSELLASAAPATPASASIHQH